jgi:hypothetical protein
MIWRIALAAFLTLCLARLGLQQPRAQFNGCSAGFCSNTSGVAATTWNPSAIGAGISLSNGNLTATYTGANANNSGKANISHLSGKFYWEIVWNVNGASAADVIGFGTASAGLTNYQIGITDNNSYGWTPSGAVYFQGASVASIQSCSVTSTCSIALDIGANLVWFRTDAGNWNNSGTANPATGVGGLSISPLGTPLFPMFTTFVSGDQLVANFGATAFAQTAPAGFGKW